MACKWMIASGGVGGLSHSNKIHCIVSHSLPLRSRSLSSLAWRCPASCASPRMPAPRCDSDAHNRPSASIEDLRLQLASLHTEAEQARARANAARARFMRLTETVENLRMRAVMDLKSCKEESARQLIAEKQKVMVALEKSKQRAELLEELSNKLGEVISSKEVLLIAALSSGNVGLEESNSTMANVRIVSPTADDLVATDGGVGGGVGPKENGGSTMEDENGESTPSIEEDVLAMEDPSSDIVSVFMSSKPELYLQFLSRVDKKLHEVELELKDFLNVAVMVLPEDIISPTANEKVATVEQTLRDVLIARGRIRKVVEQEGFG